MVSNITPIEPQQDDGLSEDNLDLLIRSDEDIQLNNHKSKRHSANVRRMRLILPIAALAVVAVLMTWKNEDAPLTAVPREQVSPQTISQNELVNPKFQSEDSNSQPYTITADKATQNAENMDAVLLEKPVADMTLQSGGWVSLKAANGVYKQGDRQLSLDGQVEVHHDSGYELHADKMDIDVTGQMITSDLPVTGHGPAADISAQGLEADGKADTVIFKGPAKLTLRKAETSALPETSPASPSVQKEN